MSQTKNNYKKSSAKKHDKGYSLNKEYSIPKKNLPKFQPFSTEKEEKAIVIDQEEKFAPPSKPVEIVEEQKVSKSSKGPRNQKKKSNNAKIEGFRGLIAMDENVVKAFHSTCDQSVRGYIDLSDQIAENVYLKYIEVFQKEKALFGLMGDDNILRAGVSVAVVAQILNTLHQDQKIMLGSFQKLSNIDLYLPELMCSVIKTFGSFACEYGLFEVAYPLRTCLAILAKCNLFLSKEDRCPQFDLFTENSILVPWNEEGFKFMKQKASKVLKTFSTLKHGVKFHPPIPKDDDTLAAFTALIEAWPNAEEKTQITSLGKLCYMSSLTPVKEDKIGGYHFVFIEESELKLVKKWCSVIVRKFRDFCQADLIKIFKCESFSCSPSGNASQLVKVIDGKVFSPFLITPTDATMGSILRPCEEYIHVSDFSGTFQHDMDAERLSMISNGLVRKIKV